MNKIYRTNTDVISPGLIIDIDINLVNARHQSVIYRKRNQITLYPSGIISFNCRSWKYSDEEDF